MSEPLILIVDDVTRNIQYLGNILKNQNYDISVAMNGRQALDIVSNIQPDLILLDVMMPELDGYEVCKQLKASPATRDIPVIFLTARTDPEDIVLGFETGAVDYITKPFNSTELLIRVKTHIELKKSREELISLNQTKDKFFSIIAHDLKGPVAALKGGLDFFADNYQDYDPGDIDSLVQAMTQSVQNVSTLLEDLLNWARSQTNRIQFQPEIIDMKALTDSVCSLLQDSASNKSILLKNEISKGTTAFADRDTITTVIRNLASNAIKFTPANGTITFSSTSDKSTTHIHVIDTGVGISEKNIKKLFKLDEQTTTLGTEKEKGSGLGLILCHEFIAKNKGELTVESQIDEGSTFSIHLPSQE